MANILVLEDDFFVRTLLVSALAQAGHHPIEAVDGPECLELLERYSAALVLLDIFVPRLGGLDVMKRLRERHPDILIIAITGKGKSFLKRARQMGADGIVKKPFSVPRLLDFIAMQLCQF